MSKVDECKKFMVAEYLGEVDYYLAILLDSYSKSLTVEDVTELREALKTVALLSEKYGKET